MKTCLFIDVESKFAIKNKGSYLKFKSTTQSLTHKEEMERLYFSTVTYSLTQNPNAAKRGFLT